MLAREDQHAVEFGPRRDFGIAGVLPGKASSIAASRVRMVRPEQAGADFWRQRS